MKKVLLLITIFAITATSNLMAQANVNVTADVLAALTLVPTPVQFGTIEAGTASYIQANGDDNTPETNLGSTAAAGALQIQGSAEEDVTVSWTNGTLTDSGGLNPATFTPTVYLTTTEVSSGATNVTLTLGDITLDIGGSLEAVTGTGAYSTVSTGDYAGTPVAFTVSYTNI